VLIDREETGEAFYQKLFELDPTLYPLFQGDIKLQAKKLIDMITLMVARLQKLDDIRHEIGELGKRHVTYGTKPAHYQTVGKLYYTHWKINWGLAGVKKCGRPGQKCIYYLPMP
jgi:hemoglobin-like flavoprotein